MNFSKRRLLNRVLLVVGGVLLALLLIAAASPFLSDLVNRRAVNVSLGTIEYTVGMGDLFVNYPDQIRPPVNPYEVLSSHELAWDDDGFRVPARISEEYDILAFGDSYTEGASVARPWPDVLAELSGLAVRNMGFRGYGPVEAAEVIEEFASDTEADIVILGMFAGNDFSDAQVAENRPDALLRDLTVDLFSRAIDRAEPWRTESEGPFRYPYQVQLGEEQYDMAFQDSYMWWVNIEKEDMRQSSNMNFILQSWQRIQSTIDPDACFILAYFPSKSQVYLPFIMPEYHDRLLVDPQKRVINEPGAPLQRIPEPDLSYETLLNRKDNVREVVGELAEEQGLIFFDLSPIFEEAARNGALLYYTYDTHWNQAGHTLTANAIADFINKGGCASD